MAPTALDKAKSEVELQKLQLQRWKTKASEPNHTISNIDHLLSKSEILSIDITDNHRELMTKCDPSDAPAHNQEYCDMLDEIDNMEMQLKEAKATLVAASPHVPHPPPGSTKPHADLRLPKLSLPTFDGNLNDWMFFRDSYINSVHSNASLSNSQKFSYLQESLSGEAAALIKSLPISDTNYDIAWDAIKSRFQNERELVYSTLRKLISQPQVKEDSAPSLRFLVSTSKECKRVLQALKIRVEYWDAILGFHVLQKLDRLGRQAYELTLNGNDIPAFDDMIAFLENRARALGTEAPTQQPKFTKPAPAADTRRPRLHHVDYAHGKCKVCSQAHMHFKCSKLLAMTVPDRREAAKQLNLCFNCLRDGHTSKKCTSTKLCQICNSRHHTLLHLEKSASSTASASNSHAVNHCACESNPNEPSHGMLATAIINVLTKKTQPQLCRSFLDGGSTVSLMTHSCAKRLGLKINHQQTEMLGLGATPVGSASGQVSFIMQPHFRSSQEQSYAVNAYVVSKITGQLPISACTNSPHPHLLNLQLADPQYFKSSSIDVLLGADIFYTILLDGKRHGPHGSPVGINSTLGWLVGGISKAASNQVQVMHTHAKFDHLDATLQRFWELENVPPKRILTQEEQQCENHFIDTFSRSSTGRMIVQLPFKPQHAPLGASRHLAIKRLNQLERRLKLHPSMRQQYNEFMREYEVLGHMIRIQPESEVPRASYYIPHQCVFNESSTTTKFRVVFDASAPTSSGVSLNQTLMVGPTIQDSVITLLMRFRKHPVAFTADLAKFYRQIGMTRQHHDFQRIVWREDPSLPITEFKLTTVTYGTAPGSFLATRALQQLAREEESTLPLAAQVVRKDFYVDDLMTGGPDEQYAVELQRQILELMKRGELCLRKFSSNSAAFLSSLPVELRATQESTTINIDETVKILGIQWNPKPDQFTFKVNLPPTKPTTTKRILLSEVAKIFDPLGWLSPVVIRAKIIFQELWKLELKWDDPLPVDVQDRWNSYREQLHLIEQVNIDRCFNPQPTSRLILHGFSDASESAYSACVYVLADQPNSASVVTLIAAKTRVAPAKPVSIPRLELCGALLLAELMESVKDALEVTFEECVAWTDSTIVLAWLNAHADRWKTFVANRVAKIQEIIPAKCWRHVPGTDNPADCASRGISPSELIDHPLWWHGPTWLTSESPRADQLHQSPDFNTNLERRPFKLMVNAVLPNDSIIYKYSSVLKLKRVTAWCMRFISNCRPKRQPKTSGPLSVEELQSALQHHVREAQQAEFQEELQALSKKQPLSSKSRMRFLSPFIDEVGIIRVGGRLTHADLTPDRKHPIILPRHSRLTSLIITRTHVESMHAGPQLVLALLQGQYWIISARDAVRHHIKKCVTCAKQGAVLQQQMGNLPEPRVNPGRPFLKCGVDYAGPFILKAPPVRSKITYKAYLAVFVCFCTKAVHLELVSALSTEAFLDTLKRFVSRRGKPTDIFSDCGTNFVGAAKELTELLDLLRSQQSNQRIADRLAGENIKWHFNPPSAPHFGGLWEAGVKSVKHHLSRILSAALLTYEEMHTIITQIEACLNSRPLTPMSTDPNDFTVLTPGHFLIGDSLKAVPEPSVIDINMNRLSRFQRLQQLQQHFWNRWKNEYLTRLQQRPKWLHPRADININDMVVIKDEKTSPTNWTLARVIQIHPGADEKTRVVTRKTAHGELKRPIAKLCLLPVQQTSTSATEDPSL